MSSHRTGPQNAPQRQKGTKTAASKDNHSVTKRLQQELRSLMLSADPGVSAFPDGDNLFKWIGTIEGGKGTVYEGLAYKLTMDFPSGYPYEAPTVKFTTPCFHPNVDHHGNICLDILKDKWSALYEVRTVLLSIQSLLGADLWSNQEQYRKELLEKYEKDVRSKQSS
ncbi:hypothetical protein C0Q70_18923 [Pomacea canaliculata]|uniref:UBC core domain-containing protein n=1 Tax=Pomacea canaliculata TaxID=400727 RepID=A0A2T7NHY4_POMCA|nr:hypothetical protein C0Q70_18923 [Pomacea canaliculata]